MDKLRFISLSSGSNGNCYFIGNGKHGILIDAGIGVKTIKKRIKEHGFGLENILAVFITHDHFDHIKSAGVLGEIHHIPIYSTENILNGINRNYGVAQKLYANRRTIEVNTSTQVAEFNISSFFVSHDATESLGYTIKYGNKKITIVTDLGYICEQASPHIKQANYLVIEANFDMEMLNNSAYPDFLRKRIHGEKGHLCNDETATFLAQHYQPHLKRIYLCHLSKQNNTPEIAYNTVKKALSEKGVSINTDVKLDVLPRTSSSECFILDEE